MKFIDLTPQNLKEKRQKRNLIRTSSYTLIIPVVLAGCLQLRTIQLTNEMEELSAQTSNVQSIQQQIESLETETQKNQAVYEELGKLGIPFNQFLLFLGTKTPDDIRLYSITSNSFVEILEVEENQLNEKNQQDDTISSTVTEENSTSTNLSEADLDESNEATEETTKKQKEQSNEDSKENSSDTILIRGACIEFVSIGEFSRALQDTGYFKKVELATVKNYYNGMENYKIFELQAEVK